MELLHCYRCGNTWRPRKSRVRTCPLCKSALWNIPRVPVVTPFDPENAAWKHVVDPNRRLILSAAKKHHARNVRVFGSIRRGDARPDSDLDLLVTMDSDAGLLDQIGLKQELEAILKRKVDVLTDSTIYWLLEPQIRAEAIPL